METEDSIDPLRRHLRLVQKMVSELVNGFVLVGAMLPAERTSLMAIVPPVLMTIIFFMALLPSFHFLLHRIPQNSKGIDHKNTLFPFGFLHSIGNVTGSPVGLLSFKALKAGVRNKFRTPANSHFLILFPITITFIEPECAYFSAFIKTKSVAPPV